MARSVVATMWRLRVASSSVVDWIDLAELRSIQLGFQAFYYNWDRNTQVNTLVMNSDDSPVK